MKASEFGLSIFSLFPSPTPLPVPGWGRGEEIESRCRREPLSPSLPRAPPAGGVEE